MDNTTTAPVLARDADGHVLLTPDQAAAVAEWRMTPGGGDTPLVNAIYSAGDATAHALARYVLSVAPVAAAAVRQARAWDALDAGDHASIVLGAGQRARLWMRACDVTESTVRAAGLATEAVRA